jgi:hypothetical protein
MSDVFADAIADLRDELRAACGAPSAALATVAQSYGVAPQALLNRFQTAYGAIADYAEREQARAISERPQADVARNKMRLAELHKRIADHNSGKKRLDPGTLNALIIEANKLGANYRVVKRAMRRRSTVRFDRELHKLMQDLFR